MKFKERSYFVLFVTFLCLATPSIQSHYTTPPNEHIPEITELQDLENILSNQQPTVIAGHMHHCANCTKFMKYFQNLPKKHPKIDFFTVNGPKLKLHDHVAKRSKYRIPGYPSIVLIKNGMIKDVQIGGNEKTLEEKIKTLCK